MPSVHADGFCILTCDYNAKTYNKSWPKHTLTRRIMCSIARNQATQVNNETIMNDIIRTKDTRYFVDPSIGIAAQGLGPNDLINDLNTLGFYFEAMCVRDLRVFADALDGKVYHFRDKSGMECDAVIHLRNGNYGLVEIKLGGEKLINEGVENLIKLEKKLNTEKMKKPSFKMILVGTGKYAYRRLDGVFVVPIGCLKN